MGSPHLGGIEGGVGPRVGRIEREKRGRVVEAPRKTLKKNYKGKIGRYRRLVGED